MFISLSPSFTSCLRPVYFLTSTGTHTFVWLKITWLRWISKIQSQWPLCAFSVPWRRPLKVWTSKTGWIIHILRKSVLYLLDNSHLGNWMLSSAHSSHLYCVQTCFGKQYLVLSWDQPMGKQYLALSSDQLWGKIRCGRPPVRRCRLDMLQFCFIIFFYFIHSLCV